MRFVYSDMWLSLKSSKSHFCRWPSARTRSRSRQIQLFCKINQSGELSARQSMWNMRARRVSPSTREYTYIRVHFIYRSLPCVHRFSVAERSACGQNGKLIFTHIQFDVKSRRHSHAHTHILGGAHLHHRVGFGAAHVGDTHISSSQRFPIRHRMRVSVCDCEFSSGNKW